MTRAAEEPYRVRCCKSPTAYMAAANCHRHRYILAGMKPRGEERRGDLAFSNKLPLLRLQLAEEPLYDLFC